MFYEISLASVHLQKTLKKYHYFQDFLDAKKCSKSAKYKRKSNGSSVKIFENNRKSSKFQKNICKIQIFCVPLQPIYVIANNQNQIGR